MNKKTIKILAFVFSFVVLYSFSIYLIDIDKNKKIEKAYTSHIEKLKVHYDIILQNQKESANAAYESTLQKPKVLSILKEAYYADDNKRKILRNKLYKLLETKYEIMKKRGILQYHFVFPNNIVFLRMHKPSKHSDDLTGIRVDFENVNKYKKVLRGFEQGRTAHGFRNVYPIYDKNGDYLAAMEVSFGSERLQEKLTHISKLHTHFLVDKKIFDAKAWQRDDLIVKYTQSAEHKDMMITMTKHHTVEKCINLNKKQFEPLKNKIKKGILKKKPFAIYKELKDSITVVSFYPIENIREGKVVAWLVSYENDNFIYDTLKSLDYIKVLLLVVYSLVFVFIYRVQNQKEILNTLVKEKTQEINNLNKNLEKRIVEEVEKNKAIQEKLFKSEKLASMGEMIGNIAHQWRQPLSVISSSATGMLIENENDLLTDEIIKSRCELIDQNTTYLSSTIDDFKNFIKGDRKKTKFNLNKNVDSFLNIFNATAKNSQVKILKNIDTELEIEAYPNELIQVFMNIFNNSKDILLNNNEDERYIFIEAFKEKENTIIKIKDNGGGAKDEIINKLFEPYFTTKHQSQGTGLGLHMVYNIIVNGMEGSIDAKNTTFMYEDKYFDGLEIKITL